MDSCITGKKPVSSNCKKQAAKSRSRSGTGKGVLNSTKKVSAAPFSSNRKLKLKSRS